MLPSNTQTHPLNADALCHTVKFSCVTVYTLIQSTGLGYKMNVLISVPFVNIDKLHHMSSSGKALV